MGLFDNILGKKSSGESMALEPQDGGYIIRNLRTNAPKYDGACFFFSSRVANEKEVLEALARQHGFSECMAPDTRILMAYEAMPGLDEYLTTQEIPESLNAFLMSRIMMKGLARGPAEMAKLSANPFDHMGARGVLVRREI